MSDSIIMNDDLRGVPQNIMNRLYDDPRLQRLGILPDDLDRRIIEETEEVKVEVDK